MKRTIASVLVAIMTILCIGGGYSESDALNDGIEAEEIILDQLPEPEQESEEDMATGDKLVNLDDLKVAYDKQQEDTNSLKSASIDEEISIGIYSGYEHDGFLQESGSYGSTSGYHSKTTAMIPCQAGDEFWYKGKAGSSAVSALFYNSGNTIIGNSHEYSTSIYKKITAPTNAAYAVFSSMAANGSAIVFDVYKDTGKYGDLRNQIVNESTNRENEIAEIKKEVFYIVPISADDVKNGFTNGTHGRLVNSDSYKSARLIKLPGAVWGGYVLLDVTLKSYAGLAFYNADKTFISGYDWSTNHPAGSVEGFNSKIAIQIPNNTYYISTTLDTDHYTQASDFYIAYVKAYSNNSVEIENRINEIGEDIDSIETDIAELSETDNGIINDINKIKEKTKNLIDFYSLPYYVNRSSVLINYPDIKITNDNGQGYSYAVFTADVTGISTIYIDIEEVTGPGSNGMRFGYYDQYDQIQWIDPTYANYHRSLDVSTYDKIAIMLYAQKTDTGVVGEYRNFHNITLSTNGYPVKYFSPLSAVDNVARENIISTKYEVPSYYSANNYIEDKIDRINELVSEAASNGDAFVFITDSHWIDNAKKSPALINKIRSETHISQVFFGGDMSNTKTYDDTYFEVASVFRDIWGDKIHYVMGNHEYLGAINGVITTDSDLYYDFRMYADDEIGNASRHYYYIENKKQKIRYIFLNKYAPSQDSGESAGNGYEQEQVTWFTDVALNVESGWTIVIITHNIFNLRVETGYVITPLLPTVSEGIYNAILNYSGNGIIAGVLCGHAHIDYITNIGTVPVIITTCDKNKSRGEAAELYDPIWEARADGTINEQAFDVFIIDKTSRKIKTVRIGYPGTVEKGGPIEEREASY